MRLAELHSAYMIGIGGIGMSAIARYLNFNGVHVQGYDKVQSPLTDALIEEGIDVFFSENLQRIPKEVDIVIYTPAIPDGHVELAYYKDSGIQVIKRSKALGMIASQGKCLAIAGSHGKSTTAGMVTHMLRSADVPCTAFVGAVLSNYNANFIAGKNEVFVIEADEYDRSFLQLHPDLAIITAVDSDHLDIYGTLEGVEKGFLSFADNCAADGKIFIQKDQTIVSKLSASQVATYSLEENANVWAENITIENGSYSFSLRGQYGNYDNVILPMGGRYNIENALAAIAMCAEYGGEMPKILKGLESFKGLKRRFEKVVDNENITFIDDYAHHPEEISALINGVKEMYAGRRITAVFQPHLYTRTRDCAAAFAASLDELDEVILLDIYPAREKPIDGVTSGLILDQMHLATKHWLKNHELVNCIHEKNNIDVLLTIGAGDIDRLIPTIAEVLNNKEVIHE